MPTDVEKPSSAARARDGERVLRVLHAGADDAVDVDVEARVLGQVLQLLVERLEALLRDLVGHDVVDRDLQVLEPGVVEPLDALFAEIEAVGDEPRQHAAVAGAADDGVEVRVHHRLAAGDGDDAGAQLAEPIDAAKHRRRSAPGLTSCRTRCSRRRRGCSGAWGRSAPGSGARCRTNPT